MGYKWLMGGDYSYSFLSLSGTAYVLSNEQWQIPTLTLFLRGTAHVLMKVTCSSNTLHGVYTMSGGREEVCIELLLDTFSCE